MDEGGSTVLLNDFISPPIIISDYDKIVANERTASAPGATTSSTSASSDTSSDSTPNTRWSTGFSDFADELWSRMTGSMRAKLREACVEVLKRTDVPDPQSCWGEEDDNTRLLD